MTDGNADRWFLYGIRGLEVEDTQGGVQDPLWNDLTILSSRYVRSVVSEADKTDAQSRVARSEFSGALTADDFQGTLEERRMAEAGSPDSFVAVLGSLSENGSDGQPRRRERAMDLAAALGLTLARDCNQEKTAFHDQPRSRIGPIHVELSRDGEFRNIERDVPAGTGVGTPRRCTLEELRDSYFNGESVEFQNLPFEWSFSREISLVRILTADPKERSEFEEHVARSAKFLFESFHVLSREDRLLRCVTVLEMLLRGDGSWNDVRTRAEYVAEAAGVPSFFREGISEVFDARGNYVHGSESVEIQDVQTAIRLSKDVLFYVAERANEHDQLGSYFRELRAQDGLQQGSSFYHKGLSPPQRGALDELLWGGIPDQNDNGQTRD